LAEILTCNYVDISMQVCGQLCANIFFQDEHHSVFTNLWKTGNCISSDTWPAQSLDINIIKKGHETSYAERFVSN